MTLTYTGKAYEHVITVKRESPHQNDFEIVSWTPPESVTLNKKCLALLGKHFDTLHHAGAAVFKITHEVYGWPENIKGRSLVFKENAPPTGARPKPNPTTAVAKTPAQRAQTIAPSDPRLQKKIPGQKRGDVRTLISVMVNQEGVEAGKLRYWCLDCGDAFVARPINDDLPSQCPKRHVNFDLVPNDYRK